jgi:hypothetical protein
VRGGRWLDARPMTNFRTTLKPVTLIAATAALAAAPAAATAAPKIQQATFDVQVEGTQSVTWSTHHESQFDCDVNIDGSGTEKTRFKSKKVRVRLSRYGKLDPIFIGPKGDIPLKGKITRNGSVKTWGGKVCSHGDGTGGQAPAPPDCGTKTAIGRVELRYASDAKHLLTLGRAASDDKDPFVNCPWGGVSWPRLLTYSGPSQGPTKDIGQKVPADELLDPSFGQHIVIGRGTYKEAWPESSATTKVRWELKLTRVGEKRKS